MFLVINSLLKAYLCTSVIKYFFRTEKHHIIKSCMAEVSHLYYEFTIWSQPYFILI